MKWNISGVDPSTLGRRVWKKVLTGRNPTLATIINDNIKKFNNTILGKGFDVKKPSTLILENVDENYDGKYRFSVSNQDSSVEVDSDVTVVVLSKYFYMHWSSHWWCEYS